jgi:hypothetical protein
MLNSGTGQKKYSKQKSSKLHQKKGSHEPFFFASVFRTGENASNHVRNLDKPSSRKNEARK